MLSKIFCHKKVLYLPLAIFCLACIFTIAFLAGCGQKPAKAKDELTQEEKDRIFSDVRGDNVNEKEATSGGPLAPK